MVLGLFWITPITNRSGADMLNAKQDVETAKLNNSALSDMRGCLNASDLTRIENDIQFLANQLETSITSKQWAVGDIPTTYDLSRILQNAEDILSDASDYFQSSLPILPANLVTYTNLNTLETALLRIYNALFEPLYTLNNDMLGVGDDYLAIRRVLDE